MKNDSNNSWIIFLLLMPIFLLLKCCDSEEPKSAPKDFGNHSPYWYDTSEVQREKADSTLRKYYEVDENGHIIKKKDSSHY